MRTAPASAIAIRSEPLPPGEALLALGAEAQGPASVAPGTAGTGSLVAPLQPGAGGAPVLDRSGRLVGLVARFPTAPRLVAGIVPSTSYPVIPGSEIAAFLARAGVTIGSSASPAGQGAASLGAAAAPVLASVVAIECGR